MTPALGRRGRPTSDHGGGAARRAVVRWAWRLFRREWRQQALVLGLLTMAVATAILFASGAYNTTGASEAASFGTANHRYVVDSPDVSTLPAAIAAAEQRFGAVELIARWSTPVPGSVDSIDVRAQDPQGSLGGPMLALRGGRYPRQAGEVALTDGVADTLALGVGDTFDLDDRPRRVIRSEAAHDLRTLTATGATSGIRRTLTAATAGGMAMLGAAVGTVGAYLSLGAGYVRDLGTLTPVPVTHLAAIAIGVPVAAAATGWLVAGREPAAIARPVIE